jgi:hypothetical protein
MKQDALETLEPDTDLEESDGRLAFMDATGTTSKSVEEEEKTIEEIDKEGVDSAPIDWEAQVEGVQRVLGMDVSVAFLPNLSMLNANEVLASNSLPYTCHIFSTCFGQNTCIVSGAGASTVQ